MVLVVDVGARVLGEDVDQLVADVGPEERQREQLLRVDLLARLADEVLLTGGADESVSVWR